MPERYAVRTVAGTGPLEIACDESGWEGENLVGSNTDVFAHASVSLRTPEAVRIVQETRRRIRSPATEYKANHLLRPRNREVLEWLLSAPGPLRGRARVHLVDKPYVVVRALVAVYDSGTPDAVRDAPTTGAAAATALYREGPRVLAPDAWSDFLVAANNLVRVRNDGDVDAPVDAFLATLDRVRPVHGRAGAVLDAFAGARHRFHAYRESLVGEAVPVLDPLGSAIESAARYWTREGEDVELVHDRQNTLTPERIAQIRQGHDATSAAPGRLRGVRLVASESDARVQVADFLAGVARKIASDALDGHADARLTGLLRPYVGRSSVWADERSWSVLARRGPPDGDGERVSPAYRPDAG